MQKIIIILFLGFIFSGILNAQVTKPYYIHKAHVKEQKQVSNNQKNVKLSNPSHQQNKKVIHQIPKKKAPIDNSIRIQNNSIKLPAEN
jgi:hypothetical protein